MVREEGTISSETSSTDRGLPVSFVTGVSDRKMATIAAWQMRDMVTESAGALNIHRQNCEYQSFFATGISSGARIVERLVASDCLMA